MKVPYLALPLLSLLTAGCAQVTPEQLASANYGDPLTKEEAMEIADSLIRPRLIDPTSLLMDCENVHKGWIQPALEEVQFGYFLFCGVNAKNSFGGYTGRKGYVFIFNSASGTAAGHEYTGVWPRWGLVE